ncbi:MAG: hypothetical protein IJ302_01835 [Clostridia bacterium]|nr:hypothetical protein [Clostridia bacterium]
MAGWEHGRGHSRGARSYDARTGSRAYRDRARQRRRELLRGSVRWLLYTVTAAFLCLAEGAAFAFSPDAGAPAFMSYLIPVWTAAVAITEGAVPGAWFGIAAGLLASAAGGETVYLMPVLCMAYGLGAGILSARYLRRGFGVFLLYDAAVCVLHAAVRVGTAAAAVLLAGQTQTLPAAFPVMLTAEARGAAAAALAAAVLYLPLRGIARIAAENENNPAAG